MRFLALLFCLFALPAIPVQAQSIQYPPTTINGCSGPVCNFPANLGTYTIATLPTCTTSTNAGYTAYVSDLGGGADNVVCSQGYWKHIRLGTPTNNASTGTVALTPLANAPIQILTGSSFPLGSNLNITTTNLYPGEEFYVKTPSTLGGLLTTLGVNLGGTSTGLTELAGQTYLYVVNTNLSLTQLQP